MKHLYIIYIILVVMPLFAPAVSAQKKTEQENIRITDVVFDIDDDSLRINCHIQVNGIEIKKHQSLKLELSIGTEKKKVILPSIIYAGKLRYRYDERKALLSGQANENRPYYVYTHVQRKNVYSLDYQVKIPYGRWLDHATLNLRQTFESNGYVTVNDQVLNPDLGLIINYEL